RQLGRDPGQPTTCESLDLLQGGVNLANGSVRARVDAADTPEAREVRQHEAQISTWLVLARRKLRASAATGGPRLAARLLSRAPGGRGTVAPALPLGGRPPSVRAGKDVLD